MIERGHAEAFPAQCGQSCTEHCKAPQLGSVSFFFFSSLQKVFRKSGGGAIPFLFCYNGPLCGDGRGKSCVPALCRLCRDSQGSFSVLLTGTGPACGESGEGLGRDGADGSAQRSCYSPAVRVALPHRGLESD